MSKLTEIEDIKRRAGIVEPDESGHQVAIQKAMRALENVERAVLDGRYEAIRHQHQDIIGAMSALSQVLRQLQYAEMKKQV